MKKKNQIHRIEKMDDLDKLNARFIKANEKSAKKIDKINHRLLEQKQPSTIRKVLSHLKGSHL